MSGLKTKEDKRLKTEKFSAHSSLSEFCLDMTSATVLSTPGIDRQSI